MVDHVTFDELRAILAPWFSDQEKLELGARVATPKEAAARAVQAALNTDGERGIVRVLVASSDQKRSVRNLLEAFFTDEPRLKPWLKRITPDGVDLSGGITIMVDTNDARRHDAIATIVLAPDADTVTAFTRVIIHPGDSVIEDPGKQLVVLRIVSPPEWPADEPIEFVPESSPSPRGATTRIERQAPDPDRFHRKLEYPPAGRA